jgi:DNA-binding transcriptional ArsR family regulator
LKLTWREERTAGAIHQAMPDVTFGAVSLQLKALLEAGLIEARVPKTDKRNRYYKARPEALGEMGKMLERMWDDALWKLKVTAELEETRRGPRPNKKTSRKTKGKKK